MLQTILVGLDNSTYSAAALDLALDWGKSLDAMVVGLAVVDKPGISAPQPVPLGGGYYKDQMDEKRLQHAERHAEQILETFSLKCSEREVAYKLLEEVGDPAEVIVRESQRYDLIVLGQNTFFSYETQSAADDTLRQVMRSSSRPVVTVPLERRTGNSVLVAYDGSLQAARTLLAFANYDLNISEQVHVLGVAPTHFQASEAVERGADYLRSHNVRVTTHAIESSEGPGKIILDHARKLRCRLIVMGCWGTSFLQEFFLGSVTQRLLRESNIPLFMYH